MPELSVGETFAGHLIRDVAGRGGMGVVYRALHLSLDRDVALKVIAPDLSADLGFRTRFQREAQAAASIQHPHVVPVYDAGEEHGQLYVTMGYVDGFNLGQLIASEGALPAERAVAVVAQIGEALDAAHARGLVHRDVKPANVLIEFAGGDLRAYLSDFGLTTRLESGSRVTDVGMFVGTLDYAAPEQIEDGPIDARTDVYALGCVLFEVLTGQVPYPDGSRASKLYAHIRRPPPSVIAVAPDVPPELDEVVRRAMAKDPALRYQSAGELGEAALAAVYGEGAVAGTVPGVTLTASQVIPRPAAIPFPAGLGGEGAHAFVGRKKLVNAVRRRYASAKSGHRQFLLLTGEPGIGKTRLAAEIAQTAHAEGATVLYGRSDAESVVPYQPFVRAVEHYVAHAPRLDIREFEPEMRELAALVPSLRRHLGAPPQMIPSDPQTRRFRVFEAVARVLASAAAERPTILVLDDLHWADASTTQLLDYVLEDAAPARLLIIGTLRDVERPRGDHLPELLARLRRQPAFERLAIREMDDEEVRSLIESSPLQNFGPAFVRRLHDETKGNPFFIRETLRSLADVVADDAADDELQRALETLVVPEGVKELISRRMEKLDETTRQVLRTASVIGHEFELTVLSELVQRPIDEILAALEEAAQAGFVRELDISIDRFAFSHAIVREALYEGQGASRRIRLHHRIGEALEKSAESQPVNPAELAYHFFMSRSLTGPDKAFGYSIQAAEQAAASAAHGVAAEHYGRASSLLAADDPTRLRILPDFGFALSLSSNIAGADAVLTEAIDLAAKAGERRIELEATIERASVRVQSDPGTAEEVIASAQDTVPALEELGDDLTLAKAWRLIGFTHGFAFSRWGAAEQALVRGLTCAERAGSRPLQGLLLFGLGAAVALGATPVPDAIIRCRELLRYADGNPAMTASILNPLSRLEASRGEFDSGRELAAQARTFYERSRNRMMIAMTALWQSDLELLTGDHEAAESLVRPAIEVFRQFGEKGRLAGAIGRLASVLDRQGRDDEAQRVLALWRDPTPQNVVSAQVLLYATRAKLLANRGRHEEGLRLAREAVQLAERTDALDMLGDALMDLAEVERRAGATDESIATLERALAAYERKGNLASAGLTSRLLASVPR